MANTKPPLIFWGSPEFALPSLAVANELCQVTAVVSQADRHQGRGLRLLPTPIKTQAQHLGLPVLTPQKLDETFINQLQAYLPATFLIVAYGKIIPQPILDLSTFACLNIHPSLLPKYRGPSPIQSALLRGETETGISLMQLDAQMDHGPIVQQLSLPIDSQDYYPQLHDKLAGLAAQTLRSALPAYLAGQLQGQPQDDLQATYCNLIKKEDGQINWETPARDIYNQIRAFTPWPGSFSVWQSQRYKIITAAVAAPEEKKPVGELYRHDQSLFCNCGQDALEIQRLQLEGKKEMSAVEFLNGYFR